MSEPLEYQFEQTSMFDGPEDKKKYKKLADAMPIELPHFNGPAYKPEHDQKRLTTQHGRIRDVMSDEKWRTLSEIETLTGDPASSISAQLRHLRKPRFGSHVVDRRRRGDREQGLFEYRVSGGE